MEYKSGAWKAHIIRDGKLLKRITLAGGASAKDEVIAFFVELKKGDTLYLTQGDRTVGYRALGANDAEAGPDEEGRKVIIGRDGTYDIHLETYIRGEEKLLIYESDENSVGLAKTQRHNHGRMVRHKVGDVSLTVFHNVFIAALVVFWLIPVVWLVLVSFTDGLHGPSMSSFFPKAGTLRHYIDLFTRTGGVNQFPTWLANTLLVSVCSTIVSTLFVLATAFAFSRFRFKKRKGLMNLSMIVSLFPGMLTMLVSYYLFEYVFHIDAGLVRLIIAYSAGAGLGYLVAKGFFDTIPMDIDEAAKIDGASAARVFFQILVPLSKPIIVYTIITSFMSPWVDFVFAKIILGPQAQANNYTVAIGLFTMLGEGNIADWFGVFAAGAVLVSIPLSTLFMVVQKYYVGGVTGGAVKG